MGALSVQYVAIPIMLQQMSDMFVTIDFVVTGAAIGISYAIGIGVGMLVSIFPALKVAKMNIVEAINPYRHEDTLYKIVKESSINYKFIIVGLLLAVNGGVIYFLFPQYFTTLDMASMSILLVCILLFFLIGLALTALGIMPVIQSALVSFFEHFSGGC